MPREAIIDEDVDLLDFDIEIKEEPEDLGEGEQPTGAHQEGAQPEEGEKMDVEEVDPAEVPVKGGEKKRRRTSKSKKSPTPESTRAVVVASPQPQSEQGGSQTPRGPSTGEPSPRPFRPRLIDPRTKKELTVADSVSESPILGFPLLTGLCLPKDIQNLPPTPELQLEDLLAKLALSGQACVNFCSTYAISEKRKANLMQTEIDSVKELKARVAELGREKDEAQAAAIKAEGELERATDKVLLATGQKNEAVEEAVKAREEVALLQKEMDELRVVHKKELDEADGNAYKEGQKFAMEKLAKQAKAAYVKGAEKGKADGRGEGRAEGMQQGYRRGWHDALVRMDVPADSDAWTAPPTPEFEEGPLITEQINEDPSEGGQPAEQQAGEEHTGTGGEQEGERPTEGGEKAPVGDATE